MEDYRATVCETKLPILNRSNLVWEIPNVLLNRDLVTENSSSFCSEKSDRYEWLLSYRIGVVDGITHLYLWVRNMKSGYPPIIQRNYCIPAINGRQAFRKTFISKEIERNFDLFINLDDASGYVSPRDTITIICEVTAYGYPTTVLTLQPKIEVPECHCQNRERLFESREFCDLTIVTSTKKEIRAHKAILAAESTVFSAMFKNEMTEKQKNRVDIIDIDPEVLGEMLRYIYTGKTPKLEEMALDLLAAADKYDLPTLKVNCEVAVCKNIAVENSVDVLVQADLHRALNMKKIAMDCILKNFKEVQETESYKTTVKLDPRMLHELLARSVMQ